MGTQGFIRLRTICGWRLRLPIVAVADEPTESAAARGAGLTNRRTRLLFWSVK